MQHTAKTLQKAFGYLYPAELPALKALVISLPETPTVLNIGAGAGTSGKAFLESRPDLHLTTIDIQQEDSPLGSLFSEQKVLEGHFYSYQHICGDSKEIARSWINEPFDMIFIDGDHTYEGCKGDIVLWLPHIKSGGIIAVHDYRKDLLTHKLDGPNPKRLLPDVDRAVDELLMNKYSLIMWIESLAAFRV